MYNYRQTITILNQVAVNNIEQNRNYSYVSNNTTADCPIAAIKNIYTAYGMKCKLTYRDFYEAGQNRSIGSGMSVGEIMMLLDKLDIKYTYTRIEDKTNLVVDHLKTKRSLLFFKSNHVFTATDLVIDEINQIWTKTINNNTSNNIVTWEKLDEVIKDIIHIVFINDIPESTELKHSSWDNVKLEYQLRNSRMNSKGMCEILEKQMNEWVTTHNKKLEIK